MAEFSAQLSQPQAAGANVIKPVAPVSGIPEIVGQVASVFMSNAADRKKKEAEEAKNRVIKEYVDVVGGLNDAVAQGAMKSGEAAMQSRARYQQFVSQYPQYISELTEASKSLRTEGQLGELLEEEQANQDLRRSILKDATSAGVYVPSGASREYEDQVIATFQADRALRSQIELNIKIASEQRAQNEEQRKAQQFMLKESNRQALTQMASNQIPLAQTLALDIERRLNSGEDPTILIGDVKNFFLPIQSTIAQLGTAYPESIGPIRTLMTDLQKDIEDIASGKIRGDAIKTRLDSQMQAMQLIALNNADPAFQAAVATGELFKNIPPALIAQFQGVRSIIKLAEGNPDMFSIYSNPDTTRSGMSFLRDRMNKSNDGTGNFTEADEQRLGTATTNAFKAFSEVSYGNISPAQAVEVAKTAASVDFYKYVERTGVIDVDVGMKTLQALNSIYSEQIRPQIIQKLEQPLFGVAEGTMPVKISFDGNSVKFTPNTTDASVLNDKVQLGNMARTLNSSVESLNTFIRANTHLSGSNDYTTYWKENRHVLLPNYFPSPEHIMKAKQDGFEYVEGEPMNSPNAWRRVNGESVGQ